MSSVEYSGGALIDPRTGQPFPSITVPSISSTGDVTINGEILTGSFPTATFGGIEREARYFSAGSAISSGGVVVITNDVPRIHLPNAQTTDVYWIIEIEEWWLVSTIAFRFEWSNDHSTTGNVRWDCAIKEIDIATQTMAAAGNLSTRTFTEASQEAGEIMTSTICSITNGNPATPSPGAFANVYALRISRLGADAADSLAGPVGLICANMTRGQ